MPVKKFQQERERKFRLLFDEHPHPMWVVDPAKRVVVEANAAAAALYGYSQEEFRGLPLSSIELTEEGSQASPGSCRHQTRDGGIIEVEIVSREIDYFGQTAELSVLTDISMRRHLEDQLRQAQKMEAVGMLAGGVAHDFNNLLTIISGYSQLILNSLAPNDPNHHSAEQIMKAGERAAA